MSATAKMLVTARGARLGTVGGGCLEAEITERALEVASARRPAISEHTLNSELAGDYGLSCGGTAVMFIEPVYGDEALSRVYAACLTALSSGDRALVVTDAIWDNGPGKAMFAGERIIGSVSHAMQGIASAFDPRSELPALSGNVLVEPLVGKPRLVVFGGGHVGARVAEAAAFAGWRVTGQAAQYAQRRAGRGHLRNSQGVRRCSRCRRSTGCARLSAPAYPACSEARLDARTPRP